MKHFRFLFTVLFAAESILAPLAWAADETRPTPPSGAATAEEAADTQGKYPEIDAIFKEAEAIENGTSELKPQDTTLLAGQYAIVNGKQGAYRLELSVGTPVRVKLAFTSIKTYIDENRQLVVEAQIGAGAKAEPVTVAKMYVPRLPPILAVARNNELLSVVDVNGQIWTADMGFVETEFPHASPFTRTGTLSEQGMQYLGGQVQAKFMTVGSEPFTMNDVIPDAVLPMYKGKPEFRARDLLITSTDASGQTKVLGVYDRDGIHFDLAKSLFYLFRRFGLLQKGDDSMEELGRELPQFMKAGNDLYAKLRELEDQEKMDPAIALAFNSFGPDVIKFMEEQAKSHAQFSERRRDKFDFETWPERNLRIRQNARVQYPNLTEEGLAAELKEFAQKPGVGLEDVLTKNAELDAKAESFPHMVEENYLQFAIPGKAYKAEDVYKTKRDFYFSQLKIVAGVTAGMYGVGLLAEYTQDVVKQVAVLDYLYTWIPAPLKNAEFRFMDIMSTITINGIIPFSLGVSWTAGKIAAGINRASQSWNSGFGAVVRDTSKYWAELFTYQRLLTFGTRVFGAACKAEITLIEKVLQQNTFYAAVNNGINPFKRIGPGTELGKAVGAQYNMSLGFNSPLANNPFSRTPSRETETPKKLAAIQLIKNQRRQLRGDAWLLAAVGVAAEHNIDLGTLLTLERGTTPSEEVFKDLLGNEERRLDWELTTAEIERQLRGLANRLGQGELAKLSYEEIEKQYHLAEETARKIVNDDKNAKYRKQLMLKAGRMFFVAQYEVLNAGREPEAILSKATPNQLISGGIERAMTPDIVASNFIPAFIGRVDMSHPENLTYDPKNWYMGYPSWPHWNDIGSMALIYMIVETSRQVMVWMTQRPKQDEVRPIEDIIHQPEVTQEALGKTMINWFRTMLNPLKSDIGGFFVRKFKNDLKIFVGYAIMMITMRSTLGHQAFDAAVIGWAYWWVAGVWRFSWPWYPMGQAYKSYTEEMMGRNEELTVALTDLSWGLQEKDPVRAKQFIEAGRSKVRELYQKYAPDKVAEIDTLLSIEKYEDLIKFVGKSAPFPTELNAKLNDIYMTYGGAIVTTIMATFLFVDTYNTGKAVSSIGFWLVASPLLYTTIYFLAGKDPWLRYDYVGKIQSFSDKTRIPVAKAIRSLWGADFYDKVLEASKMRNACKDRLGTGSDEEEAAEAL